MQNDLEHTSVWRCLRGRDPQLAIRFMASAFVGVTLAGLGILAAWAWAQSNGRRYVREEEVAVALLVAGWIWVSTLFPIWGRQRRAKMLVRPMLLTLGIAITTGLASAAIDEFVHRDEELVITAVVLIASGVALLVWMAAILRIQRGKPVIAADDQVNVHCPSCGYSLVGLCDLRCPECGLRFTIDELIRAQHYARPRPLETTRELPESTSGIVESHELRSEERAGHTPPARAGALIRAAPGRP